MTQPEITGAHRIYYPTVLKATRMFTNAKPADHYFDYTEKRFVYPVVSTYLISHDYPHWHPEIDYDGMLWSEAQVIRYKMWLKARQLENKGKRKRVGDRELLSLHEKNITQRKPPKKQKR